MTKMVITQAEYDEVNRLKKKLNVIKHSKKAKYYGDHYLQMRDFFDELNDEHRYLYFGGMLRDNQVNIIYGRPPAIAESLANILDQYMLSKIAMAKAGKDIEDMMKRPHQSQDITQIYK